MIDFPTIETQRLILGKTATKDIPHLVLYANDTAVSDNLLNMPHPYGEEDAISFINRQNEGVQKKSAFIFAIYLKNENEFAGVISLHLDNLSNKAELGYWIGLPFRNRGIVTEAAKAILKFGFKVLQLNKIYATHFTDNMASGKVLVNAGMTQEAVLKEHYLKNSVYKDVVQYRLTAGEFDESI